MKQLNDYSEDELKLELKRREEEKTKHPQMLSLDEIKNRIVDPNMIEFVKVIIENHVKGQDDEDDIHYAFEAMLEIFYGNDVWNWWKDVQK